MPFQDIKYLKEQFMNNVKNKYLIKNIRFRLEGDEGNSVDFSDETVTFKILSIKSLVYIVLT